ncbi:probable disease resistance protein At1g61300 [Gossypium arboreum]|uniref:probable disease resistance protein At1g61300 n=1 Tax=Gossypium arboreum TaxID=29729 RepID=UPI000819630A|nr:probable disease resistance protein At1g61300 [Gossypium arboreum]
MQHLRNNEVRKIGVYGMARVRKTSVAKLDNNKLLNGVNSFDILVWVTISRKCSVIELQKKIVKAMNVVITKDKDETLRARMLFEILSKNGRFVLILDKLWERFSLEKVGIPKSSEAELVVGQNLMNSVDLLPITRSIVECCASLLLVIVIVASSMRGENSLPI